MSDVNVPYRKVYLFLIGVANYDPAEQALESFSQIRNNLEKLGKVLPPRLLCEHDKVGVEIILDPREITDITDRMTECLRGIDSQEEPLVIVYYAGHASPKQKELRLTLSKACQDTQTRAGYSFAPSDLLEPLEKRLRRQPILLIFDCCFSGQALEDFKITNWPKASIMFASQPGERSQVYLENEVSPYTCFTGALIRALEQGHGDQPHFSLIDLDRAVQAYLPGAAQQKQRPWSYRAYFKDEPFFLNRSHRPSSSATGGFKGKLPQSEKFYIDCDRVEARNQLRSLIFQRDHQGPKVAILTAKDEDRPEEFLQSLFTQLYRQNKDGLPYPHAKLVGREAPRHVAIDGASQDVFLHDLAYALKVSHIRNGASLLKELDSYPLIVTPLLTRQASQQAQELLRWYIDDFWGQGPGTERIFIPIIQLRGRSQPTAKPRFAWRRKRPSTLRLPKIQGVMQELGLTEFDKYEIPRFLRYEGYEQMAEYIERHDFRQRFEALPDLITMLQAEDFLLQVYQHCRSLKS